MIKFSSKTKTNKTKQKQKQKNRKSKIKKTKFLPRSVPQKTSNLQQES